LNLILEKLILTTTRAFKLTSIQELFYPKQRNAVFNDSRFACIEASTKSGKTVSCLYWITRLAIKNTMGLRHYWWVSPTLGQSRIAYKRLKQWLTKNKTKFQANESSLTISFDNHSVLQFKSGEHPDSLYGEDVYGAVIDEASRCREEAWHAVRSTLTATNGPARLIGNVRGRKNWFYHLCRRAESGLDNFHYAKITATDAIEGGVLKQSEIAEAKEVLPLAVYQELYEAQASDNNANPFGEAAIRACVGALSTDAPFVYGVDLAKSQDWTVIIGLDSSNRVCFFERFQMPWVEQRKRLIEIIGSTDCIIDSTGVGDPITEDLQRVLPRVEGFKFSSSSKQQLMELLSTKISTKAVTYPDGDIVRELEQFEYEYSRTGVKYSAPPGLHDDCVMALALALKGQNNVPGLGVW